MISYIKRAAEIVCSSFFLMPLARGGRGGICSWRLLYASESRVGLRMCFAKVYVPVWEYSQRIACAFRVICNRPANCWLLSVVKLCLYGMCFAKVYVLVLVTYACVFGRIWKSSQRCRWPLLYVSESRVGLRMCYVKVCVPGDLQSPG